MNLDEVVPSHCPFPASEPRFSALTFGHQSRKLRPAEQGANDQFALQKSCHFE
jgi:hypothetical protein